MFYSEVFAMAEVNWRNDTPKRLYHLLLGVLQKPKVVEAAPGGYAIWTREQLDAFPLYSGQKNIFEEVILRDEDRKHMFPEPHIDCLEMCIKVDIPAHKIASTLKISCSLSYDPINHILSSRCKDLRYNLVNLKLAMENISNPFEYSEGQIKDFRRDMVAYIYERNNHLDLYNYLCKLVNEAEKVQSGGRRKKSKSKAKASKKKPSKSKKKTSK